MNNDDRFLLIETSTNVKWIRESIDQDRAELKSLRKQVGLLKKYVYMGIGGLGMFQILAYAKQAIKP